MLVAFWGSSYWNSDLVLCNSSGSLLEKIAFVVWMLDVVHECSSWRSLFTLCDSCSLTSQKPTTAALKPAFPISKRDVGSKVGAAHYPAAITEKSPEVEDMEIVTSQLSTKLCIEDIDATDCDNPQLCAEYVKEIYEYMMMLEVIATW